MKLMLWVSFSISFPVPFVVTYLKIDPLYALFEGDREERYFILQILVRIVVIFIIFLDVTKAINAFFIVGLMVTCSMNDILQDLTKSSVNANSETRLQEVNLYKKMFIWNKYTNQNFCTFSVPPLIFFGFSVVTLSYYGTIRMAGEMNFLLYLCLPTIAFFSSCFVIMLIPHAARVVENAENFIFSRTNWGNLSKFERKTWKSVRSLGIQVGPFGYVIKDLKMLALRYISENTINLLMTF